MSGATPTEEGNRSPSLGGRMDAVCDRFEAAWKAGRRPPIEDYLGEVPEAGQTALFHELLVLELTYRRRAGDRPTPEEYQCRFPEHVAVIETILGAAPPARAARPRAGADPNLLFGLLALQNNFIDRDTLVAAFAAWVTDKSRDLGRLLLERGAVDAETHALVEALARKHLKLHGGDLEESLAALSSLGSVREDLERVADPELQTSLTRVPRTNERADPDATAPRAHTAGTSTAAGMRFRILRLHRTGGLGAVYVAHDEELHREVALKEIRDRHAHDPDSRSRFVQEAEITGRLEHPGIIPVYGLGTYADGRPFYAMRFIKGDNLKDAIARFHEADVAGRDPGERALALRELLRRFVDVCNAMAYAHSRGILHRDLKPNNILLGPYGETLVVDWGLAKPVGRPKEASRTGEGTLRPDSAGLGNATRPGDTPGTPAYMSPEQAAGDLDRLGLASDVYSLGATLYCLLTGKPPFEDRDVGVILRAVQEGQFQRPSQLDPSLDKALEAVCLKAMARKPEDRYATPKALAEDLERWMADEPVSAWREPLSRRARRWARRNRTAVITLAASVLVALAGMATVLAVQTRANADLKSANTRAKQRFDLAMEAIKLFHGEVGDDLVLQADQFKPLRDKLLRGAADFYGKLEGLLKGQPDRASRGAMGNAYFELGELTAKIGDKPAALAAHRKGLAVRRELASEPAADAEARDDVATSLQAAAYLLDQTGNSAEALARFEEARDLLEGLPLSGPGSDGRRALLGTVYRRIGGVLASTGKPAAAMSAYQRSVETLTRLADDKPAVTDFRSDLAVTHNNIGTLQSQNGKPVEALESYRRALAIQQKLADDNPAGTNFQSHLAVTHNHIGILQFETDKPVEALESYRRALAIQQKLADDNPAVTDFQSRLADSHNDIGILQSQTGKPAEALESYGRAVAIRQKLADVNPAITEFQRRLADSHNNIGALQSDTGKPVEALESYGRAVAIQQKLADDNPEVPDFRNRLASSHANIGSLLMMNGRAAEAVAEFSREEAISTRLVQENPSRPDYRNRLANCQTNTATALLRLGRPTEARALCERAAGLQGALVKDHPETPAYREGLGESLLRSGLARRDEGDASGAAADWRGADALLEGVGELRPEFTFLHACCHASLSWAAGRPGSRVSADEADAEAAKALALLRRAAETGFRDPASYRNETALDPLRDRPDFRLLMMDLAFPGDPFAR